MIFAWMLFAVVLVGTNAVMVSLSFDEDESTTRGFNCK